MANQWAFIIGINQYKAVQPLMYAQADAVALRNLFVDKLGVSIHNCTLLTDVLAGIEPHAYVPLKAEIEHQLHVLCSENVQPGDLLWVFFSGFGLAQGDRDYWMALDSDPTQLEATAIPVSSIFEQLSRARTDNIVLAMDMNRSKGAIGNRNIGTETLQLAQRYGISTFLSCQPEQYAHETLYVKHGLFTKALLEGLYDHGCVTAAQLADYLSARVPELCDHYLRSRSLQNPVAVIPEAKRFMMVLPQVGSGVYAPPPLASGVTSGAAVGYPPEIAQPPVGLVDATNVAPPGLPTPPPTMAGETSGTYEAVTPNAPLPPSGNSLLPKPSPDKDQEAEAVPINALWKWGIALALLAFLAGVLLQYRQVLFQSGTMATRLGKGVEGDVPQPANGSTPSAPNGANSSTPMAPNSQTTAPSGAANGGEALFPNGGTPQERGETALNRAEAAIAANRYGEAREWLAQVPPEMQNERFQAMQQQVNSKVASAAVRNQEILGSARKIIRPTSASAFNDAIEQARQVPPQDPFYAQAQADIARWSQVILDLAEGRAVSGDIPGAIAAAKLVPEDQPEVSTLAKQRIAAWEKQIANQELIQKVQNSLQPGQASSYNDAIRALKVITPDQAGYALAREKINQWSSDILAIARARAAQNDLAGAIAAAQLVPPDTDAYAQAQAELQRWQSQQ